MDKSAGQRARARAAECSSAPSLGITGTTSPVQAGLVVVHGQACTCSLCALPEHWCDYCERYGHGTAACPITDHDTYDRTYGQCPWTDAEECAMAAEREVAGTDAAPTVCGEHADRRDVERETWNAALARGDADEIAALQDAMLRAIHTRIMDDDPNYGAAGWTR